MKKKLIVGFLTLLFVFVLGCACTNKEKDEKITLVDFEATKTEAAADIGDLYELRRLVLDEDGNEYVLNYEVKDSEGKVVSVIANCFEVTDSNVKELYVFFKGGTEDLYLRGVTVFATERGRIIQDVVPQLNGIPTNAGSFGDMVKSSIDDNAAWVMLDKWHSITI